MRFQNVESLGQLLNGGAQLVKLSLDRSCGLGQRNDLRGYAGMQAQHSIGFEGRQRVLHGHVRDAEPLREGLDRRQVFADRVLALLDLVPQALGDRLEEARPRRRMGHVNSVDQAG
jgi:hypothetical protein